jgi:hypothetical protein
MKKITILSVLLVSLFMMSSAQNEKFFRFGLHGSPGIVWIKPDTKDFESKGIRLGFGYGLITEFSLADNYSFTTGIESFYNGGKLERKYTIDSITTTTYKLQYLEIPVALKMKTNEINYITYFAKFGGSIGARLNSKADITIKQGSRETTDSDQDINKNINLFRVAFQLGVGIEYSLGGSTAILVGLNFNNGLTDILKNKDKVMKANNNYISLNLGVLF